MNDTITAPKVNTTPPSGRTIPEFLTLVFAAIIGAAALFAVGYVPTKRMAGHDGLTAMAAGIGICVASSILAALPIVYCRESTSASRQIAFLGTVAVRMLVTLVLFASIALADWFSAKPLAIWTGLGYLCLLAIETAAAIHLIRKREAR